MSILSNAYNAYVGDIIKLTRSIVLKSVQTINTINTYLSNSGDNQSLNPLDWKYYRNIAGLRYLSPSSLFDDPIIEVFSLDSNTIIPFTPSVLTLHPITLADFRQYEDSYAKLLALYPDQELLLRGVINPVDPTVALAAPDHTLLTYDPTYIGKGERSLISDLQQWINNFTSRYNLTAYGAIENLYPAAFLAILYLNLVPTIINLRFQRCKTEEAHEFHIWNYLSGYFNFDRYRDVIHHEQALFLYRNIAYITANAGKQSTLDFLNQEFASKFGLQLFSHDIQQVSGSSLEHLAAKEYDLIKNDIVVQMYPYGNISQVTDANSRLSPEVLTQKLISQAILNPDNIDYDNQTLIQSILATNKTNIPTGVIECNVVDSATVSIVSVVSEKIHNWLYLTARGFILYKYKIAIPSEGIKKLNVSAQDAAVLLLYASAKYFGVTLTTIPQPVVRDIMATPTLSETILRGLVEPHHLLRSQLINGQVSTIDNYQQIQQAQTLPRSILSTAEFTTYINEVVTNKIQHHILPDLATSALGCGELTALVNAFYINYPCSFVGETTFAAVFQRLGIDLATFSNVGLRTLINGILSAYLALTPETITLQQPYASMVEILRTLCSYTLQFVDGASTNNIEPIDWQFSRPAIASSTKWSTVAHVSIVPDINKHNSAIKNVTDQINVGYDDIHTAASHRVIACGIDYDTLIACPFNHLHIAHVSPVGARIQVLD